MQGYRAGLAVAIAAAFVCMAACLAVASTAQLFFSADAAGVSRVTTIQEGRSVWIAVLDPDENTDCDVRDKIWTDVKLFDPKTGAYLVWISYATMAGDANGSRFPEAGYVPFKGRWPAATPGWLGGDYLEETEADSGVFVSKRPFRIGARENVSVPRMNTHVVCASFSAVDASWLSDFIYGNFLYASGSRRYVDAQLFLQALSVATDRADFDDETLPDAAVRGTSNANWVVGRFENMDTLVGMFQDPNDEGDVAVAMMKVFDSEATIAWDREIYADGNEAAAITIVDRDENLDCARVEHVPVFILVNPGSWNPSLTGGAANATLHETPTNFCALLRGGGVDGVTGSASSHDRPIRWYNIYHSELNAFGARGAQDGRYYIDYPVAGDGNVTWFDTMSASGVTAVSFFATETATGSGEFQLDLNALARDLGFRSLRVHDVLVAYYLDPNDFDDFKLATATIEERAGSVTSFVDAERRDVSVLWLGQDSVYVQVIDETANVDPCCPEQVVVHICDPHEEDDAEWLILDELGADSSVFWTRFGVKLLPVWDALGLGDGNPKGGAGQHDTGGFQLLLDNWRIEAFNEDDLYARYNDVDYTGRPVALAALTQPRPIGPVRPIAGGLSGLGDSNTQTSFPPRISSVHTANDVSFDLVSIGDTQVFDGQTTQMGFVDRQGRRAGGVTSADCLFVWVRDPDQNEDNARRERIAAFWDGAQGGPIGPEALNAWTCGTERKYVHPWNRLFGDTNVLGNSRADSGEGWRFSLESLLHDDIAHAGWGKLYVANPRNGRWVPIDLLETDPSSGEFTSVICIDLASAYGCVPTLGALPGDTILAVYEDPSNHSDSAWISIKVGVGGGTPTPNSTTQFVDNAGSEVSSYTNADSVTVRVVDPSHDGAETLVNAITVDDRVFSLQHREGTPADTFFAGPLDLDLTGGGTLRATYTDPTDPADTSFDVVPIVASELVVTSFLATPNPLVGETAFTYEGSGTAAKLSVSVYDLAGHLVWEGEQNHATRIVWDGTDALGEPVANGPYVYVITATGGQEPRTGRGILFVNR